MSQQTRQLSEPGNEAVIGAFTLGYIKGKNKNDAHSLLLKAYEESGLSQKEIARRLRKQPAVISRSIGAAGNLTLDTLAELVFAMTGKTIQYSMAKLFDAPTRNTQTPACLLDNSGAFDQSPPASGTPRSLKFQSVSPS